ncbi:hypothetical protein TPHA_0B02750 [Tetrapisispora phaffii CBS 4417]|uniref:BAR domain-containing protein n=1 Tax=Tetrapisispora phaffii (strain ATCC 24235 / CBS 4417 / NBRC 1672 / NRRL Y-8282 / UCD 70-5) TaxID=1071381 RepID=G8BPL6_TETPH|nr:hypothetical protein TPHA_0B02750 [Tetrapisispora phaffii CBS 4417]CCE61947.1 hypothetical protein TPHA_0B02750 [Tetrapisispora phaffii CBS 4417]
MAFNSFSSSFNKKFQELSEKTQEMTSTIPHVAQNTQRLMKEKLGQAKDISTLPQEYVELETKIDTMKEIYEHFLKVTMVYEKESYDYPKEFGESFWEFTDSVGEKFSALNISEHNNKVKIPKTLNYALHNVFLTANEKVKLLHEPLDNSLSETLASLSETEADIAEARLHQDSLVKSRINYQLKEELSQNFERAAKYRKAVHHKRFNYDVAKTNFEHAKPEKQATLSAQADILKDEFEQATKDATIVMQEIISNSRLEHILKELAVSQLVYHQRSTDLLNKFLDAQNDAITERERREIVSGNADMIGRPSEANTYERELEDRKDKQDTSEIKMDDNESINSKVASETKPEEELDTELEAEDGK